MTTSLPFLSSTADKSRTPASSPSTNLAQSDENKDEGGAQHVIEADVVHDFITMGTTSDSNAINNRITSDVTAKNENSAMAAPEGAAATATAAPTGFFSRMQSIRSNAVPILGDVYDRAQKRASQLREQAATEMERLRQQQLQQGKEKNEVATVPPSKGTLVESSHGNSHSSGTDQEELDDNIEGLEKEIKTEKITTSNSQRINSESKPSSGTNRDKESKLNPKSITSPIRSAIAVVRQTSQEVARDFILPPGTSFSYESNEDTENNKASKQNIGETTDKDEKSVIDSEPKSGNSDQNDIKNADINKPCEKSKSNEIAKDDTANATRSIGSTRLAAATSAVVSAYTEFRAVGRYRVMKDNEPPQNAAMSHDSNENQEYANTSDPRERSEPKVGGADRVGGLRNLQLGEFFAAMNSSFGNLSEEEVQSSNDDREQKDDSGTNSSSLIVSDAHDFGITSTQPISKDKPKLRTSYYEEAVKSVLQPGQRALFFGRGTMGVILKPTYLASWRGKDGGGLLTPYLSAGSSTKKGGVFIDCLIPGGHAEKSGVVFVGDHVLKIGRVDVSNMTLEEVVKVINEAKRPNIMVLTSEHFVELVTLPEDESVGHSVLTAKKHFTSPLDLVFGFVNKIAAEGVDMHKNDRKADILLKANFSNNSLIDDEDESDDGHYGEDDKDESSAEEIVLFNASGEEEDVVSGSVLEMSGAIDIFHKDSTGGEIKTADDETPCLNQLRLPKCDKTKKFDQIEDKAHITSCGSESIQRQIDSFVPASFANPENIETLAIYASHRTNGLCNVEKSSKSGFLLPSMLERAVLLNNDFHQTLRHAFVECCSDPRKCNFLKTFFQSYSCIDGADVGKDLNKRNRSGEDQGYSSNINVQQQLLDFYLELSKFRDAVGVCSVSAREQLLELAKRISGQFLFDENDDERQGNRLPEHIVYQALGGSDEVQSVKLALLDEDQFFERADGDGFYYIRSSLEEYLSVQNSFLSFLISDDCARMRAYLRGAAPFLSIDPVVFLKPNFDSEDGSYKNILLHAILHLLCLRDNRDIPRDAMYRNDAISASHGNRVKGAISILSCSVYITRTLRTFMRAAGEGLIEEGMTGETSNGQLYFELLDSFQFLWEGFIAPGSGSLASISLSVDAQSALDSLRRRIVLSVDQVFSDQRAPDCTYARSMARLLTSTEVSDSLSNLSEALIREYTLEVFPKFRRHIFYEWICKEAESNRFNSCFQPYHDSEYLIKARLNELNRGWMNKALRQIELPHGLSLHRPGPREDPLSDSSVLSSRSKDQVSLHNADVAIVFGTEDVSKFAKSSIDSSKRNELFRRFACVPLHQKADNATDDCVLRTDEVPATIEQYSTVPPFHDRPFQGVLMDQSNHRISYDGWEVSLTNFVVPSGPGNHQFLYCVSLVFNKSSSSTEKAKVLSAPMQKMKYPSEREINDACVNELVFERPIGLNDKEKKGSKLPQCRCVFDFESPLINIQSKDGNVRKMKVTSDLNGFNNTLKGRKWSQSFPTTADVTIGLVLISNRNVTLAMRDTLSLLYDDFCCIRNHPSEMESGDESQYFCQPLVDILGVLASPDVEKASLAFILESYISFSSSRWINRPLVDQSNQLVQSYGAQLTQSLPPVALAILFSTILLEQKVVLSSSRRGLLTAASHAIIELIYPLKWPHLFVPLVPVSMIDDLVHYPAPFILGIPEDEKSCANILDSLPSDVTLVNLDFGRVILASEFVNNGSTQPIQETMEETINPEKSEKAALRDQVLLLAESLGGLFGTAIHQQSWCCDSAVDHRFSLLKESQFIKKKSISHDPADFLSISKICKNFLTELLSGIPSCCLWLEEKVTGVPTGKNETAIIFDEDRFLHLKNLRAEGRFSALFSSRDLNRRKSDLTLSLLHFDVVLETFLRTQSLSTYICSRDKCSMLYW